MACCQSANGYLSHRQEPGRGFANEAGKSVGRRHSWAGMCGGGGDIRPGEEDDELGHATQEVTSQYVVPHDTDLFQAAYLGGDDGVVWRSYRDNPVIKVGVDLFSTQQSQTSSVTDAGATIRYGVSLSGTVASGLTPIAEANVTSGRAWHRVNGIALNHGIVNNVTLVRDNWSSSPYTLGTTGFTLHPDVLLVPVRVLVF